MPRLLCLFFFLSSRAGDGRRKLVIPSLSRDLGTEKLVRVLVMGVYAQAAGCLPCGLRSLWLALPGGGKKPHWGFF